MTKNKIKLICIEISRESTFHAIPNIAKYLNKKLIFFVWIITFIAATVFCSYLVALSIYNFFQFEVTTNIEVINESPALFPTVTFCNLNGLKENLNLSDMFLSCRFHNQDCNITFFREIDNIYYGKCFRFNGDSKHNRYSYLPGKNGGLIIELFAGDRKSVV